MAQDMTQGKIAGTLWRFSLPLLVSMMFQQLYQIADSAIAGRYCGENALAAVGNSYEITLIFIAFAFGCNIGCSVLVAQLLNEGTIAMAQLHGQEDDTYIRRLGN